ncbi:MAG: UDP-N-acetylglucosamine--N-acetylmuramyl-(pentapeptide) pyrophosphoryl-undecaprenol N-acetylglucosamine transferase [bacterium]
MNTIFLLAGRTGGPFFPLPTIAKSYSKLTPIYIGVKGGFEEKYADKNNVVLEFLPDSRLKIVSFKNQKVKEIVIGLFELAWDIIKLGLSFFKSIFLLLKYRPEIIYSAGSFLAVPMVYAAKVLNFLSFTTTQIQIHQQDPMPGLANKLTVKFADKLTCVFDYTKQNYPLFKKARVVANPIDKKRFDVEKPLEKIRDKILKIFLEKQKKPILMVFGGGSGAQEINQWLVENSSSLLKKFAVVHLTGVLQTQKLEEILNPNYFRTEVLFEDMPLVMKLADRVICRAGMASISELLYLKKKAFLIPLEHSHQELNAELVEDKFVILRQGQKGKWVEVVLG